MPTLQESIDTLDHMVTNHASTPEIRSQIAYVARETATLEAQYMSAVRSSEQMIQELAAQDQKMAAENRHKFGVTLTSGVTRHYDGDSYAVMPHTRDPKLVEFRKTDASGLYEVVATVRWTEIAEIHTPMA